MLGFSSIWPSSKVQMYCLPDKLIQQLFWYSKISLYESVGIYLTIYVDKALLHPLAHLTPHHI